MSVEYSNSVSAPESLDVKFFQEVLENALLQGNANVKKISFEMGIPAGDNYCSQIYRVRLSYQQSNELPKDMSLIVKSITVSDHTKFLEDLEFFLKEKITYTHILPRMEIFLDNVRFGPKLYHSHKEPINTLVFEDLSKLGYIMEDRVKGLDFKHCQIAMKKIGQFHGASLVMNKKDPHSMKNYEHGIISAIGVNGSDFYEKHFGNLAIGVIELISEWKGFEIITKKLQKYSANIKKNLIKAMLPIPGELRVLNHGDLWVNNMLFRYNQKQDVDDIIFIDFQLSIFGSPGYDINYFLNSSAKLDVLKDRRDDLLKTYHASLFKTLAALNYEDIPSFDDILTEVRRREFFGLFASTGIFPGISMEKSESGENSLDKFCDEDFAKKARRVMFSSKRVQDTLRYEGVGHDR